MGRFRSGMSAFALVALLPGVGSAQVVLEGGGVTLRAPAALDCAALPVIAVEGGIAAALTGDRAALGDVVTRMSLGIASACPAAEALRFEGTERDVTISFRTEKAEGWQMPGAPARPAAASSATAGAAKPGTPVAATAPAATTAAAAPPAAPAGATASAEPAPEAETAPTLAPGVDFAAMAAFYGGVPTLRGHATLQPSETWTRILAARAYAERPDILADDMVALELAQLMLSPVEFQQFAGPLSQQATRGFQNLSVFDRRDLAERVRTQLKPYLDQRRQTGPIDVVHVTPVRLGEYSFERGAFPFQSAPQRNHQSPVWRGYRLTQLLDAVAFPTELRTSVEEARQIDEFLRARRNPNIYLGVFVSVDPRAPEDVAAQGGQPGRQGAPVAVRQVALFFDEELTQMLFDYTPVLAERQEQIAGLQAEFARPRITGEGLVKAIATASGDATVTDRIAEAAARAAQDYQQQDPETARRQALSALDRASGSARQRFGASLRLSAHSEAQGGLPVSRLQFEQPGFSSPYMNASLRLTAFPDLALLPMTAEVGARVMDVANRMGIEAVVDGDVVQGSVLAEEGYVQIEATITPRRILIFSGGRGQPVAERELLADITLPDAPTLPAAPFATFGGTATP